MCLPSNAPDGRPVPCWLRCNIVVTNDRGNFCLAGLDDLVFLVICRTGGLRTDLMTHFLLFKEKKIVGRCLKLC